MSIWLVTSLQFKTHIPDGLGIISVHGMGRFRICEDSINAEQ